MFTLNQAKSVAVVVVMFWMTTLAQAVITGTMTWAGVTNTTPIDKITSASGCWAPTTWADRDPATSLWANSTTNNIPASPLTTTVSGLNPTKTYEIFVQFIGVKLDPAWMIAAALTGGTPVLYWSDNAVDTGVKPHTGDQFSVYEHSLGTVSGVTSFGVDVSQPDYTSASNYSGVSYQVVPEPAAVSLLLLGLALAMRRRS